MREAGEVGGSETTDSEAIYAQEAFGSGNYQATTLSGGLSRRALDRLWILCSNHRNVMTVPFFPICQGSNGKKRIIIL